MSTQAVNREVRALAASVGRAGLHGLFPDDFEYYVLGLDLTDSEGRIADSLVFPVMPDNIVEPRPSINTVKKTSSGVVSLYNTTFVPFDISIKGSFGRRLRVVSSNGVYSFTGIKGIVKGQGYDAPVFNTSVKSGYGLTKMLEKIKQKSLSVDDKGKPVRLYYYNLALNSQYLVEFTQLTFSQDRQSNMIWNYAATFKAIAPAYSIRGNSSTSTIALMSSSILNKSLDSLVTGYKNVFNSRKSTRLK